MGFLVNIDVPDLERAVAFYGAAFGLTVARRFGVGAAELVGGPTPIYVLEKPAGSTPAPGRARDYARHWTPVHLDFVVDDSELEAAVARAVAAGATVEQPVTASAWGRIAVLADPFGHGVCILSFVGRGYDEIAT
jgi:predicted enzyme related to lactoylglutathione lyase